MLYCSVKPCFIIYYLTFSKNKNKNYCSKDSKGKMRKLWKIKRAKMKELLNCQTFLQNKILAWNVKGSCKIGFLSQIRNLIRESNSARYYLIRAITNTT